MSEIFLAVTVGRGYVIGIFSGKARGAAKYPAMHRTVPTLKDYLAQNVNSTRVEKLCSRQSYSFYFMGTSGPGPL